MVAQNFRWAGILILAGSVMTFSYALVKACDETGQVTGMVTWPRAGVAPFAAAFTCALARLLKSREVGRLRRAVQRDASGEQDARREEKHALGCCHLSCPSNPVAKVAT